jgi:hypothetical protein
MKTTAFVAILLGSAALTVGQVFPGRSAASGGLSDTNSLSPVPPHGVLLVDYEFISIPDTLDVYYEGANVFSSGWVSGSGQFVIPYGPGMSDTLSIVMDQLPMYPDTLWMYTPTVVPEPGSLALATLGGLVFTLWRFGRHRTKDESAG